MAASRVRLRPDHAALARHVVYTAVAIPDDKEYRLPEGIATRRTTPAADARRLEAPLAMTCSSLWRFRTRTSLVARRRRTQRDSNRHIHVTPSAPSPRSPG